MVDAIFVVLQNFFDSVDFPDKSAWLPLQLASAVLVTDCNLYLVLPILPYSANSPVPGRTVPVGEPQLEPNRDAREGMLTAQPSHSFISNMSWYDGHKVCAVQPLRSDPQHP